jgi:hypothetical protein
MTDLAESLSMGAIMAEGFSKLGWELSVPMPAVEEWSWWEMLRSFRRDLLDQALADALGWLVDDGVVCGPMNPIHRETINLLDQVGRTGTATLLPECAIQARP